MDFKVFIEIPAGGSIKYEVDEETGELSVDRFLHTAFSYPFNYGYIKDTMADDDDPMDVVVLSSRPVVPGVVMKCHEIGLLEMEDEGGIDAKVLAVPDKKVDPDYGHIKDISEVSESVLARIKHFFERYKDLEEGKWVKVKEFKNASFAAAEIMRAKESLDKK